MGHAQTAVVRDPMGVAGSLFVLCSNVGQVADPTLTSNFEDLFLDDWREEPGASMLDCRFLGGPLLPKCESAIY